jgi:hypothetical protein
MKEILLGGKFSLVSLVDDEDYDRINDFKWTMGSIYPFRAFGPFAKRKTIALHREVINAPKGVCVDHINFDYFDNRKSNLRLLGHGESCGRTRVESVRGVRYLPSNGVYAVMHGSNFRYKIHGVYTTYSEAISVREQLFADRMAKHPSLNGPKLRVAL